MPSSNQSSTISNLDISAALCEIENKAKVLCDRLSTNGTRLQELQSDRGTANERLENLASTIGEVSEERSAEIDSLSKEVSHLSGEIKAAQDSLGSIIRVLQSNQERLEALRKEYKSSTADTNPYAETPGTEDNRP